MNAKLIFITLFATITLTDVCHGGMYGGPGGFGPSIAQANTIRQKLIVAQIQIKACVRVANASIQFRITAAKNSIDQQIKNSGAAVGGGQLHCVNAHKNSLSQANSDSLTTCDQSAELNNAVTNLAFVHSQLWMCRMSADPTCYENLDNQITDQVDNSKLVCDNAPSAAAECINQKVANAAKIVSDADQAFISCNSQ